MIYLDSASTTEVDSRVVEAMMPYITNYYGNAGTLYDLGIESARAISKAREQVAALINAEPEQIIFTSGGTESNNMVFQGTKNYLVFKNKTHIVSTQIEHDSVLNAVKKLCEPIYIGQNGAMVQFDSALIPPMINSCISYETAIQYIESANTGLVSIMHTNNETGLVNNNLEGIGKYCSEHGILFHSDCVQAITCNKIDVNKLMCDFLSISSHKIHGVKGVGALYIRNKSVLTPLICGGGAQEFGLRGGTENVAGIVGFGMACQLMKEQQEHDIAYVTELRNTLYKEICKNLLDYNLSQIVRINGDLDLNSPGKTINLRFDGVDGETLLIMLNSAGVCATAGSACRSHESEPSRVLLAMGISAEDARNSIRFSLSRMNSKSEVEEAAKIISDCVNYLHK